MTPAALLAAGARRLAGGDSPRLDAELLLAHALGRPRTWLIAHRDDALDAAAVARYEALLARRAAGEPVAYLLGRRGFWTLELDVAPGVLVPRPETELLVELALARIPTDAAVRVADLGTGSGAIALALASERPAARVDAVDASVQALAVAGRNRDALGIGNVELHAGDWFAPLAGRRYALVASNPPYLAADDPHLEQGDLRHEPRSALVAGVDGLDAIRRIAAAAPAHLEPGGWLLVEHGLAQGAPVRAILAAAGFRSVATEQDLEARDRVTLGRAAETSP
ncbi:peptide chain release factor N(5)-glutamine methyltransferase [Coralloluteibacterium stylophorae]|uniref:Release factor glutamine methyltransferase n=1 Tax=Coralloluteibacterium stylophorae TaxID=1776034 RepID=A0A8J7VYU0_9GAMM|nr:peptide chain release factor N(5)-glutamine methyltransferase [Coralloluteibacterium stylophorae]MBS7456139.1 peptide chain release factor N(5)-glutamine methyltransferase [Coralloluteibacterium stylophorae]